MNGSNASWRGLGRVIRRTFGLPLWPAGGIVLLYHRVADLASDPQCLGVTPARFAEHLDAIAEHGTLMPLDTLLHDAHHGGLPRGAVAVTLDDGYADTLHDAAPLLDRGGVPATVFVTTGTMDRDREFWWDELERLLLLPNDLPRRLQLPVGDETVEWDLGAAARWTAADATRHAPWNVEQRAVPTARHRAYGELCSRLKGLAADGRDRTLEALAALAGAPRTARPTHRTLTAVEVRSLSTRIAIGCHTESHPSLARLAPGEQRREIARSRRCLESLIGRPVTAFAYPFGGPADVADETATIAYQEGMTLACTAQPGSVRRATDTHRVPRVLVRNWPRSEFLRRWRTWTAGR